LVWMNEFDLLWNAMLWTTTLTLTLMRLFSRTNTGHTNSLPYIQDLGLPVLNLNILSVDLRSSPGYPSIHSPIHPSRHSINPILHDKSDLMRLIWEYVTRNPNLDPEFQAPNSKHQIDCMQMMSITLHPDIAEPWPWPRKYRPMPQRY